MKIKPTIPRQMIRDIARAKAEQAKLPQSLPEWATLPLGACLFTTICCFNYKLQRFEMKTVAWEKSKDQSAIPVDPRALLPLPKSRAKGKKGTQTPTAPLPLLEGLKINARPSPLRNLLQIERER